MTAELLVTASEGISLDEAKAILQKHRIEKLPLVDSAGRLRGLIAVKDIVKRQEFPYATRDDQGRLRVATAIGVGDDVEAWVEALVHVGEGCQAPGMAATGCGVSLVSLAADLVVAMPSK